ncbi:hypothetical protein E2C01_077956 [Portunus trituberculatus]|uniref:Uncharacterized protein n=1 Tax=Portunus trituberculatus TaxID=210409 RepID=A0A5B7ICQ9_PORTR|nr:hypothetical protein [Portunus trituberculatus]
MHQQEASINTSTLSNTPFNTTHHNHPAILNSNTLSRIAIISHHDHNHDLSALLPIKSTVTARTDTKQLEGDGDGKTRRISHVLTLQRYPTSSNSSENGAYVAHHSHRSPRATHTDVTLLIPHGHTKHAAHRTKPHANLRNEGYYSILLNAHATHSNISLSNTLPSTPNSCSCPKKRKKRRRSEASNLNRSTGRKKTCFTLLRENGIEKPIFHKISRASLKLQDYEKRRGGGGGGGGGWKRQLGREMLRIACQEDDSHYSSFSAFAR